MQACKLKFIAWGLALVLCALSACKHGGMFGPRGPEAVAPVYTDSEPLMTYVDDDDTPQRKAAMRMMDQALSNPRPRDLISDLEGALKLDPRNPFAYYFLAKAYVQKQDFSHAEVMARKAEQLFNDKPVWRGKAIVLQAQARSGLSQPEKARSLFEKARSVDPANPTIDDGLKALTSAPR